MLTKISIASLFASLTLTGAVFARNDQVLLSPADNTMSVSGDCARPEVLIILKKAGTDDIWGSSNPPCVNGHYSFVQELGEWRLTQKDLDVSVVDGGYDAYEKKKLNKEAIERQSIHISEAAAPEPAASSTDMIAAVSQMNVFSDSSEQNQGMLDALVGTMKQALTLIADTIRTSILHAVQLIAQAIRVEYGGDITVPAGDNQIAGSGRILAGATEVFVPNTQVTDSAKIIVTPVVAIDMPLGVSEKIPGAGFRVVLPRAAARDIPFDWLIIKTYGQSVTPPTVSAPPSAPDKAASSTAEEQKTEISDHKNKPESAN